MKGLVMTMRNGLLKQWWLSLMCVVLLPAPALALKVNLSGPQSVCPSPSNGEYSLSIWTDTGLPANRCSVNSAVHYPDGSTSSVTFLNDGNSLDNKYKIAVTLKQGFLGQAILRVGAGGCSFPATGNGSAALTITARYKPPYAISGPSVVEPGQTVQYLSSPVLGNTNGDCYFHHQYSWSVPAGWSIQSQGFANGNAYAYLGVTVPPGTADGSYAIQVRAWFNDINVYSAPTTFYVTVKTPMCGDAYCDAGEQSTCPDDCYAPVCSNQICEAGEDISCPMDCCPPGEICPVQ
jgi:hypothetical protein